MIQAPLFEEIADPQARRDDDLYETFVWQTEALLARVTLRPEWHYMEPCAGRGAIARRLQRRGLSVWTNDLEERDWPLGFVGDARAAAAWGLWRMHCNLDVVITNLPFVVAAEILPNAVERARVAVCTILRSTWDEPTEDRQLWLKANPPTAQIAMPRADYRNAGNRDSATHHWFIWAKVPGFVDFHHDTVTWAERDERIAAHKLEEAAA